ncbi:MAG TPA: 2-dehydropantoate 2-reductase [Spirochaetota bacterium]|nr:2-dehydropantoate 2-reductase [Spirochaetota bacterium]HPI90350.1 2-dehydropantoate 2-reductase [Spirochaetota bacterium]HPR48482.1 2-dehydropantoate 2-reductase [Spirochaetota bacterium]
MIGKNSSIVVVGTGAIGGVTAALMKNAGFNVEVVCKYPDLAEKIIHQGIHAFGIRGDVQVPMPAVATVKELSGKKDVVFLATKATDMLQAARDLLPFLNDSSVVVSLQNGLCEDAIGEVVGRHRTIGCVVGWGGTMHSPGEVEMTSSGEFIIGNIDHRPDDRLVPIKQMLDTVLPTIITENTIGHLYSKLIINACITSLGALCGLYLGQMLSRAKIRRIFMAIMKEAIAVADGMGLRVEPYSGKLDYYKLTGNDSATARLAAHLLIMVIGIKYRRLKSSSLQSLERGKPTEIDYLNGYICAQGDRHGVDTPVNDAVVKMIREIEQGARAISIKNFSEPEFGAF